MTDRDKTGQAHRESDEMLMALADGELPEPERSRLLARIAADPALAARHALFVETRALVREAHAAGPVPERLRQAVLSAPPSARLLPFPTRRSPSLSVALAASLALAIGLGGFLAGRGLGPDLPVADPAGAAALLLASVPTGGSAAQPTGGSARVLGSYRTDLGLCRLITLDLPGGGAERAVVCREGGGWTVALSVIAGAAEAYLPASETATALIDTFLDEFGAGPALDTEAETAALAEAGSS